jgi:hypothetical protein
VTVSRKPAASVGLGSESAGEPESESRVRRSHWHWHESRDSRPASGPSRKPRRPSHESGCASDRAPSLHGPSLFSSCQCSRRSGLSPGCGLGPATGGKDRDSEDLEATGTEQPRTRNVRFRHCKRKGPSLAAAAAPAGRGAGARRLGTHKPRILTEYGPELSYTDHPSPGGGRAGSES